MTEAKWQVKFTPEENGQDIYTAQGAEVNNQQAFERPVDGEDYGSHPEHNDTETAQEIVEQRKSRAKTMLKIAAGVGVAAVTVAVAIHKGRNLPPFNHD